MQMKLVMPFVWDLNRLNKVKIFVHEEISIPKPNEFTAKTSYSGAVNGIDVTKNLVLDNSKPQKDVLHFMLPKSTVMQVADQVNKNGQASTPLMTFTLQPGGAAKGVSSMTGNVMNPTNVTKSQGAVGGGNMTNQSSAKAANETASTQSGGNNSMAGSSSSSNAGSGNATQYGNQTTKAANQQSANQTGNDNGNPLAKIPIIGKIFGGK
jgi:hypothetical protein